LPPSDRWENLHLVSVHKYPIRPGDLSIHHGRDDPIPRETQRTRKVRDASPFLDFKSQGLLVVMPWLDPPQDPVDANLDIHYQSKTGRNPL
jgi:hypothetical protein